jgi:hypothetical protein
VTDSGLFCSQVGLDGVYCPLLLLNKKKYACISVSERDGKILKKKERLACLTFPAAPRRCPNFWPTCGIFCRDCLQFRHVWYQCDLNPNPPLSGRVSISCVATGVYLPSALETASLTLS